MIPKPLSDRVILRPVVQPERTSGGLIIPEVAKERPQEGEVIAVGPGKPPLVPEVHAGDHVLYGKYTGTEITVENQTYLILRESDILAILP